MLSIAHTDAGMVLDLPNTVIVVDSVVFGSTADTTSSNSRVQPGKMRLRVMLMDTQQALVYRGVIGCTLTTRPAPARGGGVVGGGVETGVLSDGIQMWTRMWAFDRLSFYSTVCAVSHSSLLAVQNSPRADIVVELARIGRNCSLTVYYDLIRLDLLSGAVYSTIFAANVSSLQQHSRLTHRLDSEEHFVSLYDPLLRAALYTMHVQSWQTPALPPQSPSAAGGGLCTHSNCLSSITR